MKIKTAAGLIVMGVAIPLMAATQSDTGVQQAGHATPGSANTSYRLEINFDTGRAEVKPEYEKDIQRVTDYLKNYPYSKCEVQGYTDNVGSNEVNLKISQDRADNVRKYMIDHMGITPDRLKAKGYGNADPVASNDTEDGRRQNRRIIALIKS